MTDRIRLSPIAPRWDRAWSVRIGPLSIGWKKLKLDAVITDMVTIPNQYVLARTERSTWHVHGWRGLHLMIAIRTSHD